MNQTLKTIAFVGVALCSVVVLAVTEWATAPRPLAEFGKVGQPFFPEFTDPSEAVALRVVDFDEETASAREFSVELRDGVWRIPSHYNYPADAAERLAKTAASVIGITRGALVSRHASDHERYGVVDPLADETVSLKGRGQRLTLFKEGEVVLADLIIGKKVEGEEDVYFVRRADEKETYRAKLQIDLSTKFKDWVERDLLKASSSDFTVLAGERPIVDESRFPIIRVVGMEKYRLTRKDSLSDWQLDGIDPEKEELDQDAVRDMVFALSDLELVGVRPKPKFRGKPLLTADLKFNLPEEFRNQPELRELARQTLMADLQDKGFFLASAEDGTTRLFSREGQLYAGTKDGVAYWLHFGNVFTGTEKEIELGGTVSKDKSSDKKSGEKGAERDKEGTADAGNNNDAALKDAKEAGENSDNVGEKKDDEDGDEKDQGDEEKESSLQKSRFVFIRATVDESLLGPKPQEPVKPQKPEGLKTEQPAEKKQPSTEKPPAGDASGSTQKPDAQKGDANATAKPAADSTPKPTPKSEPQPDERPAPKTEADKSVSPAKKADDAKGKVSEEKAEARATSLRSTRSSSTFADDQAEGRSPSGANPEAKVSPPSTEKPSKNAPAAEKTPVKQPDDEKAAGKPEPTAGGNSKAAQKVSPPGDKKAADEAAKADDDGGEAKADRPAKKAGDSAGTDAETTKSDGKQPSAGAEKEEKDPQKAYEEAMKEYEQKLEQYKRDLKEYEEKLEKAKEKVNELNARFADWYYLISADAFDKLRLTRDKIVKPKKKEEEAKDDGEEKKDDSAQ